MTKPSFEQLQEQERKLTSLLSEVRKLTGKGKTQRSIEDVRAADRARKNAERRAATSLVIPDVANPARRESCEADPERFLRTYLAATFKRPFTRQQIEIIDAIMTAAKYGGYQAIAASRGEGKTVLAQALACVYCILTGVIHFPLICAATGPHAERILGNVKRIYTRNELLKEDYPEVCVPLWDVRTAPQKGLSQHVDGKPTFTQWAGDQVILPTVDGSKSSGAIIATKGLDAAIRGIVIDDHRPDLILLDDPETRESARSEDQCVVRELIIEEDLAGLGSQDKPMAMLMLTTIQNRRCLSAKYTDPKQKPAWRGRRFRLIEKWPDQMDLWDEYIMQRAADQQAGDEHARNAHQRYLSKREAMDAGAVVANPHRFKAVVLPDGSQLEVSALQACMNIIADRNKEHFDTEYQNDPPEESGPQESGITGARIQRQVSGYPRRIVPPGCVKLTQGIDCKKAGLHWVVRAWREDGTGYTIDYGFTETYGTVVGSDEGLDEALLRALRTRYEQPLEEPYTREDGAIVNLDQVIVDAGWRTEAIYKFCREAGLGWRPGMGFGRSAGCAHANFSPPVRSTQDKKTGDRWFLSRQPAGVWLVCDDTDHWKAWEHDHWMRDPDKAGALLLWGEPSHQPDRLSNDQKAHFNYSKHLTAEVEVEEPVKGILKRYWKSKSDNNHYFDASRLATVAAAMAGINLLGRPRMAPQASGGGWFAKQSQKRA